MSGSVKRAGLVVATRQFIAVVAFGVLVLWLHPSPPSPAETVDDLGTEAASGKNDASLSLKAAIALADLFLAAGFIATSEGEIGATAGEIGRAARLIAPQNPKSVIDRLVALAAMAALGCAAMTLSDPPAAVSEALGASVSRDLPAMCWSGAFSIGFAFFATTARSALMSLRPPVD